MSVSRRRFASRWFITLLVLAVVAAGLVGCAPKPDVGGGGGTPTATTPAPAPQPGPVPTPQPPAPTPGGTDPAKPSDPITEIPDDYPEDFCPIYEPSTIVEVTYTAPADEDFRIWIIDLVSKHEPKVVEAFYLKNDHFDSSGPDLGDLIRQVFLFDPDNGLDAIVNIEPPSADNEMAEYAKEGYKSYIVITVGKDG